MLTDPGQNKPPVEAKALRLQAWKRPKTKAARDKRRTERIAGWEAHYGSFSDG